jgi:hypothetical protein
MDEKNFPVQCNPIMITKKKENGDIKNETV